MNTEEEIQKLYVLIRDTNRDLLDAVVIIRALETQVSNLETEVRSKP